MAWGASPHPPPGCEGQAGPGKIKLGEKVGPAGPVPQAAGRPVKAPFLLGHPGAPALSGLSFLGGQVGLVLLSRFVSAGLPKLLLECSLT